MPICEIYLCDTDGAVKYSVVFEALMAYKSIEEKKRFNFIKMETIHV